MTETNEHSMKVVCAWCGDHLKGEESAEVVSHSICLECMYKEMGGEG